MYRDSRGDVCAISCRLVTHVVAVVTDEAGSCTRARGIGTPCMRGFLTSASIELARYRAATGRIPRVGAVPDVLLVARVVC